MFGAPAWLPRTVFLVLAALLVPVLMFSWLFELTPEGLKRESEIDRTESVTPETGKKLDRIIMATLALALAFFAFDRFVLAPQRQAEAVAVARKEGGIEALVQSYGDKSIAVLPFINLSPDKEQEYFADGITEELLNLLAKIPQIRTIARTSSFSFKGQNLDVTEIARRLSVVHVLEGSVRASGQRVRITAQLIDARTATQLWSETYDRAFGDLLAVQDEIASAVVAQLKLKMLARSSPPRKSDPKARAFVMQAWQLASRGTLEGHEQAYALLQEAIAINPDDPLAWDCVAFYYQSKAWLGAMPQAEGHRLAREAIAKALAVDPNYARSHARLGALTLSEGDLPAAATHVQRALDLEPTSAGALGVAATLLDYAGRLDQSIAVSEYLTSHDPVNPIELVNLGEGYLEAGRYAEAIANFRTVLSLTPGRRSAQYGLVKALLSAGKPEEALAVIKDIKDEDWRTHFSAIADHAIGRNSEADAALAKLIKKFGTESPLSIAEILASRGEVGQAWAWLDKAAAKQPQDLALVAADPELVNLKNDPRWLPFLRKIGRTPEQLAAIKLEVKLPDPTAAMTL